MSKEDKRIDVFISGHPFKVIAKIVDGDYVYWKFSAKRGKDKFYVLGPHHFAKKKDKREEHYDEYFDGKKIGRLKGLKPPKFAGMIFRSGMMYPMLNGYICVDGYGPNGENGFIDMDEFRKRRRLYKILQKNTIGQPIIVTRIKIN